MCTTILFHVHGWVTGLGVELAADAQAMPLES